MQLTEPPHSHPISLMNIRGLELFCELVETKSFRKAGEKRGVSQSAVSQLLLAMERQLKVPLVVRKRTMLNGFEITPEGKLFHAFAKRAIRTLEEASRKMQERQNETAATIRLESDKSVGLYELPGRVKQLEKEYPGISVHTEYCESEQIYEHIMNGVDLGLVEFPRSDMGMNVIRLRNEPLVLACHPRNRLAKLNIITSRALKGERMLAFGPDSRRPGISTKLLKDAGLSLQKSFCARRTYALHRSSSGAHAILGPCERVGTAVGSTN